MFSVQPTVAAISLTLYPRLHSATILRFLTVFAYCPKLISSQTLIAKWSVVEVIKRRFVLQ